MTNSDNDEWIVKDSAVHRRMADVRNQVGGHINEADALNLVRSGGKNPYSELHLFERTELSEDEIEQRAFFDQYTPTFNFRYMMRTFKRELTRARRYRRPLAVAIVIIDGLPGVFHQYGAHALDQCIMSSAETLILSCRADIDMVGRYGEDRFMLILPETPGSGAAILCEKIRKKFLDLEIDFNWYRIQLTTSVGISYYPGHGGDVEELIAQADLAAETVQENGGNGIAYAPETSGSEVSGESWG
jgi:diguanylate cyclase (GGDEF)-like protein